MTDRLTHQPIATLRVPPQRTAAPQPEVDVPPILTFAAQRSLLVVVLGALILQIVLAACDVAPWARGPASPESSDSALPAGSMGLRIDVNAAAEQELGLLPGVGPVMARRLLQDRLQRGPFTSLHDLARVPGIGPKTLDRLGEIVVVGPGEPSVAEPAAAPAAAGGRGVTWARDAR